MDFAYWLPIAIQLVSLGALGGVLFEKIRQLERRLNGNGNSVPGRCKVHEERLDNQDRRLDELLQARGE